MTATTAATATNGRTARKVLGSLGVIGVAAAVAGMGTFGSFTDSTTPLNATVGTGTLSLDLNSLSGGTTIVPMTAAGFIPGDSVSRAVQLANSGDLAFSTISMATTATTSSLLDTDKTNGLQMTVASCPVKWTETVTNGVSTHSCASAPTTLASGPAASTAMLGGLASLNAKGTDQLLLTLSLPLSAGNDFQGKTSALSIQFNGSQKTGTNR